MNVFVHAGSPTSDSHGLESEDDDVHAAVAPLRTRLKRKRPLPVPAAPSAHVVAQATTQSPGPPPPPGGYNHSWQWVPSGQWVPQAPMQGNQWSAGGPLAGGAYLAGDATTDSVERATRRLKRALYEEGSRDRKKAGTKPHSISVQADGEIDGGCAGKNAWDRSVRVYVPKILDMSVIDWEKQRPEAVDKLRDALDKDFEYLNYDLSMIGFRNAIKKYLKTERSRLKAHFVGGDDTCPVHVNPDQWKRLQAYWGTDKQLKKAATMAHARRQVKNYSSVGRKGRAGKEASLVSVIIHCDPEPFHSCHSCFHDWLPGVTFTGHYISMN